MKLTLRDFFWLIFVAAMATMWWIDRARLADRLEFYENPPDPFADTSAPTDPFGRPASPSTSPVGPLFTPAPTPISGDDPFAEVFANPAKPQPPGTSEDPFAPTPAPAPVEDPFVPAPAVDPFG